MDIVFQTLAMRDPNLREEVMVMEVRKLTETVAVVLAFTVFFLAEHVSAAEKQDTTTAIQVLAVREAEVSKNLDLTEHQNILGPVSTESAEPRTGSFIDLSSEIDHSIETSLVWGNRGGNSYQE